jgi:hypothetical protein
MHAIGATAASVTRANGDAYAELRWHHIQPFRAILTNAMHLPPAAGAALIRKVQHMLHPLKIRRQGAAIALPWLCPTRCWCADGGWIICWRRRRVLTKCQRQLRSINPFSALSKAGTLQCVDDLFQRRNPSLRRQQGCAQCRDILRLIRSVGGVIGHKGIVADRTASRQ